jgi:asparagine synthase (glutamine-hydrolysing)
LRGFLDHPVSAIAGVASSRTASYRENQVNALLSAQRLYGSTCRRLARVDAATFGVSPSPNSQSVDVTLREHLMLVADLRIDNRDDVLARLGRGSEKFSDSELLLAAWLKAGEECLGWMAGDFACALFDSRTGILSLARDPIGQMPLHYAQNDGEAAFASMPTALGSFLECLSIDGLALAATTCSVRDDDPRSHFEGITRVLPGEIVRLHVTNVRRNIYWTPSTYYDEPKRSSDLVEEYRHVLDVAVDDCLKGAARPLATHLSSGYDSSAVTATAARLFGNPAEITAFTSAPAVEATVPSSWWRIGDESKIAAATASELGVRHIVVRDVSPMRTVMRRQFLLNQELNISVPNLAWLLQIRRQAAELGADRILSGDCGNASLNAGGLYVLSEWISQGRFLTWLHQARRAAGRRDTRLRGVLWNSFMPWIPEAVAERLRKYYLGAGPQDEVSFLRPDWRIKALNEAHPAPRFANGYEARVHLLRNGAPGLLRKGALAGEGIEERDPLADRRLIEFSLRIPPEQLYWNGVQRPLARIALADRVPKSVIDLPVRGLQAADWAARFTRKDAGEMLEEISTSHTAQDLFDLTRMRAAIDRWPTEDWNELPVHREYRQSLIGALSAGMFALVHEQGASVMAEQL